MLVLSTICLLLLAACGGPSIEPPSSFVLTGAGVPWQDYPPGLKAEIDAYAANKSCGGLQLEYYKSKDSESETVARTGHSNTALGAYIGELMKTLYNCTVS